MEFAIVVLIVLFVLSYGGAINTKKLYEDNKKLFALLKESDYDFLVKARYGAEVDPNQLFEKRIKQFMITEIDQTLPYYLKSIEILAQHYTIPVAISRSIETAPDMFKDGLREMIKKIDEGDSSIDPYIEFAEQYPVRDSLRMMRLLYRLSIGAQENKQEQLLVFSKSVSSLQNKAREQKYQKRLDKMEKKTLAMLMVTGGGTMLVLFIAMMMMMMDM